MDYEKAYKAVLQTATQWIKDGCTDKEKICLECVFPELRESEDERVRKWIIEKVQGYADSGLPCPDEIQMANKALDYLEKQKEQEPVEIHIDNPNIQKVDPDVKISTSDSSAGGDELLYVSDKSYKIGFRDGVASVKPAEWSEEDNIGWDEAFACVTRAEKAAKNEEELQNAVTAEKWLKEIKFKYYVHPVKQEWSEEDEEVMEDLYNFVISNFIRNHIHETRWKPWKTTLERNRQNRLKSPRSSWKPSEEQQEVDLEKETKSWILNECGPSDFSPFADHWCADDIMATARHFYELGKNSK